MSAYKRPVFKTLAQRLSEPRRFIQVLSGPRQTGKTTLARQLMAESNYPVHYASADEPMLRERAWIEQQWETLKSRIESGRGANTGLLILDEIQKIPGWSETVKRLWDEDSAAKAPIRVLLLGSSALLVKRGLSESLAGRFEVNPVTHWSFAEMRDAFGWDLERYVYFGGYPGAAELIEDRERWARYIIDSLVETSVSRDIFLMARVDKPALLRRMFELGCAYSGQVLSYQKMLGQLHDAGNTTTLAHYLNLLQSAGLLAGLPKYSGGLTRQRASSPKFLALNTSLITAPSHLSLTETKQNPEFWGRLIESTIGAHLFNGVQGKGMELFYWLDRNQEVDYVLARGKTLTAIEVTGGRRKAGLPGLAAFSQRFKVKRKLLVGGQGIPLEEFLLAPAETWLDNVAFPAGL